LSWFGLYRWLVQGLFRFGLGSNYAVVRVCCIGFVLRFVWGFLWVGVGFFQGWFWVYLGLVAVGVGFV